MVPSGDNVPVGRQLVLQFDRPVVPIGRMERRADELPITIEPALACDWRWIDPSALACQLGEETAFRPATRYDVRIGAGFAAMDGSTLGTDVARTFTTERPRVLFTGFATWRSPGMPVIRVIFNQPVSQASAAAHLFLAAEGLSRIAVTAEPEADTRELPRFMPLPGELAFVDLGARQTVVSEDAREGRVEARRVWLLAPVTELPTDRRMRLRVEPGLESADGPLTGDETRVVVEFDTFPEYAVRGIVCTLNNSNQQVRIAVSDAPVACNPMREVGIAFTTPTIATEVRDHLRLTPDLAGGRTDYDPWANAPVYSQLRSPHQRGRDYVVWLPELLRAFSSYRLELPAGDAGPRDEFGRGLSAPLTLDFRTDHRPPDYTIVHPFAVIEAGVDSEVPLYATNLSDARLNYRRVLPDSTGSSLTRVIPLPAVEDVQYAVPFDVRELLDGRSGAIYGRLSTTPAILAGPRNGALFAEVTPWQVHAKLGHFNSLVWVTELATGEPVRDAEIRVYVDSYATLGSGVATGAAPPDAMAVTDRDGLAVLAGTETLDPTLALRQFGCDRRAQELCPRLFVRVDRDGEMALLPLEPSFEVNAWRVSNYAVSSNPRQKYGHLQSWGTTAQGVYRAGDTIDYKIWVRNQSTATQVPAPPGPYRLEIVDPMGQIAARVDDIELSAFGAFDGKFPVPESAPVGWYEFRLSAGFDDTPRFPLRVLVTDFTPSAFRVSATLDGDSYVAGSEVRAEAEASLFSGGPYRDAEARLNASLAAIGFSSPNPVAAGFRFDGEREQDMLTVAEEEGPVDADGRFVRSFTLPPDLGRTMSFARLRVEAAVRDDRGRYIAGTATALVHAVDRIVGLRSSKWIFREGEPAVVDTLVVDTAGNPAAGTAVAIRIDRLETRATRVRGAGNAFLTETIDEWIPVANCDLVSTTAPLACDFVPADPGRYRIAAEIADSVGRAHSTEMMVYVQGQGRVVWNGGNDDALDVVPEQNEYQVGDTARYLVQNPYPGAEALITIERYGVIAQWTETFETSTPVLEFEVAPDYLPGFYLSILVMSPRVAAPEPGLGELDLGKPAFKMAYLAVPVVDPYKELEIEVTSDAESYKPRERVALEIRAQPRNREEREQIEVAVVVLDEAVLDLIQDGTGYYDPYAGFNRLENLDVMNYGLLTRLVGRQRIELKGATPGGDGGASLALRSLFRFVAFYEPALALDSRGRGRLEFELPDNLTGWRVLVLGATPTDRFGLGEASFVTTRPTEIRPLMPNQVSEGDTFNAGASVMNRTDLERTLTVRLEAEGDLSAPAVHEQTLVLAPFARGEVYLPLEAARLPVSRERDAGAIRFTLRAADAIDGDALAHELPVGKQRVLQSAASFGTLAAGSPSDPAARATEPLQFPPDILADAGEVGVEFFASVIGNVEGAFRAAKESDYLFWELMLTKAVMASHYQELTAYVSDEFEWPASATLPEATLARAAGFQAPNGGMTWLVPQDQFVSPYLSAYTALAFAWLRRDGHAVPAAVEDRLLAYLDNLLRREVMPDFYTRGMASTVRAVALAALAESGRLDLATLTRYREHVQYMDLFGRAHYLMAAAAVPGAEAIAAETGTSLLASSVRSAGKISFNESLDDGYTRILATPTRTQCAILSALSRSPASFDEADAFLLVRTITAARGNRLHWENAQENVFCMNAIIDYAERFESAAPMFTATAVLDGEPLGLASFDDLRDPAVSLMRPIAASDVGARRELTIDADGPGRLYYAARMTYAESPAAGRLVNAGIEVRREYSVERNGEWVLLGEPAVVAQGELVRVDLFVSLPTARQFVVVDDAVPGGLEPVNRDLANASVVDAEAGAFEPAGGSIYFQYGDWRYYSVSLYSFQHQELRHDRARFYSDYLPPGNYLLSYTAQAIAAGSFSAMPTRASEAYDPDIYGLGTPATLTVDAP
jgi:uncharacterized protein YfaS (alpha-2-macroglobulin family)